MLNLLLQSSPRRSTALAVFGHLGTLGLFSLAILDGSPMPTFGGLDILLIVLVATKRHPWYEYTAAASAGAIIGAWLTFTVARKAGAPYLQRHFGHSRFQKWFEVFERHAGPLLAFSAGVPFPFPTSAIFGVAGVSGYPAANFLAIVSGCRILRYTIVAIIADRYGRTFARILRHPLEHWQWLLVFTAVGALAIGVVFLLNRRMNHEAQTRAPWPAVRY